MFLVMSALLFGYLITYYNIPFDVTQAFLAVAANRYVFMGLIVVLLLICGMFFLLYELLHLPLIAVYISLPVFLGIINAAAFVYGRRRIISNMEQLY